KAVPHPRPAIARDGIHVERADERHEEIHHLSRGVPIVRVMRQFHLEAEFTVNLRAPFRRGHGPPSRLTSAAYVLYLFPLVNPLCGVRSYDSQRHCRGSRSVTGW